MLATARRIDVVEGSVAASEGIRWRRSFTRAIADRRQHLSTLVCGCESRIGPSDGAIGRVQPGRDTVSRIAGQADVTRRSYIVRSAAAV
jgi:hypothetical protein